MGAVAFDPWMSIDLSQRLRKAGINMVEVTQTANNQEPMANQLIDLIRQRMLTMYPSKELRLAASKTVIIESARGYRLGKVKGSDCVDPIVALSMAYLLASREESLGSSFTVEDLFTGEVMFQPQPAGERLRSAGTALAAAEFSTDGAARERARPRRGAASWRNVLGFRRRARPRR